MIDVELGAAEKTFRVNVISTIAWAQKVYHAWMGEHGGAMVNVASVAGLKPAPGIGVYGTSKSGVIHVTEELAVELGPEIRVNAVAPAVVKTKFASALYEGREEEVASAYPLKRLGVPDDVGSVVAFLLSEDAAWITGQTITIDGGVMLTGGV
jgi:3-oxoacyl-[acyl-carrier protein] reductase